MKVSTKCHMWEEEIALRKGDEEEMEEALVR